MKGVEKKQIPFALSRALNSTAFDIRRHEVKTVYPTAFEQRDQRFIGSALRVSKSTKAKLQASVYDRFGKAFLVLHARGGKKIPRGNNISIPSVELAKRRTGRGVPKSLRPRAALNKPNTFKVQFANGQRAIVRRKTKKRLPLQVLYILEPSAVIKKTFPFYPAGVKLGRRAFPRHFHAEFEKAMATARK